MPQRVQGCTPEPCRLISHIFPGSFSEFPQFLRLRPEAEAAGSSSRFQFKFDNWRDPGCKQSGFPGAFASAAKIAEDRVRPIFFGLKGAKRRWSKADANALLAING